MARDGSIFSRVSSSLKDVTRRGGGNTKPQGGPSYSHWHGRVENREKNPKLYGKRKYEEFSEMIVNTPEIGAGMKLFLDVIKRTEWEVVAKEDDPDSERYAETIREMMDEVESGWHNVMQQIATYKYWGFSIQEWTARKLPSGAVGFKDIAPRMQQSITRWQIGDAGEITGVVQTSAQDMRDILMERRRVVYAVDQSITDHPEGMGILRQLYSTYRKLVDYLIIEDVGFDTDLRGVPVAKIPLARLQEMKANGLIDEAEYKSIIATYKSLLQDHSQNKHRGVLTDSEPFKDTEGKYSSTPMYDIDLLKGSGGTIHQELQKAIMRLRNNIGMMMGTSFLFLGEDGVGSLALSDNKIDAFYLMLTSTLQDISFVAKRDILRPMAILNGWDESKLPDLVSETPKFTDILRMTEALRNASTAFGPLPIKADIVNSILTELGLPNIDPDEFEELEFGPEGAPLGHTGPGGRDPNIQRDVQETRQEQQDGAD